MPDAGTSEMKTGADPVQNPVVVTAPPAAAFTVDARNPLPEPSFVWRRTIACAVAAFSLGLAGYAAGVFRDHHDMPHLYDLTIRILWGAALVQTYYFVAPSASELTNMIQSASIIRHSMTTAVNMAANAAEPAPQAPKQPLAPADTGNADGGAGGPPGADSEDDAAPSARGE